MPRVNFLGGRFDEGRFGKGPICPAPAITMVFIIVCIGVFSGE